MDVHISWYSDANAKLQPGSNVTRGKEALTQVGARLVLDCSLTQLGRKYVKAPFRGGFDKCAVFTSIHKYTQVIREGFDKCAVEFREARALCS